MHRKNAFANKCTTNFTADTTDKSVKLENIITGIFFTSGKNIYSIFTHSFSYQAFSDVYFAPAQASVAKLLDDNGLDQGKKCLLK